MKSRRNFFTGLRLAGMWLVLAMPCALFAQVCRSPILVTRLAPPQQSFAKLTTNTLLFHTRGETQRMPAKAVAWTRPAQSLRQMAAYFETLAPQAHAWTVNRHRSVLTHNVRALFIFELATAFYRQPWFAATVAILLGLLVYVGYLWRVSHLKLRQQTLERMVSERTQQLRESEERFQQMSDNIDEAFYLISVRGDIFFFVSPAYERIWGRSALELYAQSNVFHDALHPEDREHWRTARDPDYPEAPYDIEYRIVRPSGEIRWVRDRGFPVFNEHGVVYRYAGIAEDITLRKSAEQKLREFESFRLIADATPMSITLTRRDDGTVLFVNQNAAHTLGLPPEKLLGRRAYDFWADPAGRRDLLHQLEKHGKVQDYEFLVQRDDGKQSWSVVSIQPITIAGEACLLSAHYDITQRKQAEEKLERFARQQAALVEANKALLSTLDLNHLLEKILQAAHEAIPAAEKSSVLLWEEKERLLRLKASYGYSDARIANITFAEGTGYVSRAVATRHPILIRDAHTETVLRYEGDIAEMRAIQSALVAPLQWQNRVLGVISLDATQQNVFHEHDLKLLMAFADQAALAIHNAGLHEQMRLSAARYHILFEEAPTPLWEIDFTRAKALFTAWRAQGIEDLPQHFAQHPEALRQCLHGMRIIDANRATLQLYEAISLPYLIAHAHTLWLPETWQALQLQLVAGFEGKTLGQFETKVQTLLGKKVSIWGQWHLMSEQATNTTRLFVATLDITAREKAWEELRASGERSRALSAHLQSLREQERLAIARDLHDELGQVLSSLKMDLSFVQRKAENTLGKSDASGLLRDLSGIQSLITVIIQKVRSVITELRPEVLHTLGLLPALEWQIEEFHKRTNLSYAFDSELEELTLDKDTEVAVFRIFQESLTNIARHSHATEIRVHITQFEQLVIIEIRDNGRGVFHEEMNAVGKFGLLGMRERAQVFGGDVEITGIPDAGTTITIKVPV